MPHCRNMRGRLATVPPKIFASVTAREAAA
jgi:hypothetical protein